MDTDPRIEAVMAALAEDGPAFVGSANRGRVAVAAVTALDAYDGPKFSSVVHECCERPTEVDLRKRIAQEIEAAHRTAPDCCAYDVAARIARGTDPGKDTR